MVNEDEKQAKYGDKCSKCKTEWTKTPKLMSRDRWWHCEKCKKKAEDIEEPTQTSLWESFNSYSGL